MTLVSSELLAIRKRPDLHDFNQALARLSANISKEAIEPKCLASYAPDDFDSLIGLVLSLKS